MLGRTAGPNATQHDIAPPDFGQQRDNIHRHMVHQPHAVLAREKVQIWQVCIQPPGWPQLCGDRLHALHAARGHACADRPAGHIRRLANGQHAPHHFGHQTQRPPGIRPCHAIHAQRPRQPARLCLKLPQGPVSLWPKAPILIQKDRRADTDQGLVDQTLQQDDLWVTAAHAQDIHEGTPKGMNGVNNPLIANMPSTRREYPNWGMPHAKRPRPANRAGQWCHGRNHGTGGLDSSQRNVSAGARYPLPFRPGFADAECRSGSSCHRVYSANRSSHCTTARVHRPPRPDGSTP